MTELRELVRLKDGALPPSGATHGRTITDEATLLKTRVLPKHLGWGSQALTKALRATRANELQSSLQPANSGIHHRLPQPAAQPRTETPVSGSGPSRKDVRLYPDIALSLLREREVAPGRLWLLLRHLDSNGRGWIEIETARRQLTGKESDLRVFGWRQMRKLLARGESLFWFRDGQRLWLRSPLNVAAALGVDRLSGRPVALPVSVLLQSIGLVRAHFYASFHSGRNPKKTKAAKAAPISRSTLQALCQTSRSTQRQYEKRTGVQQQRNFAIGKKLTVADFQNQAWDRGRAALRFKDRAGQVGRTGTEYTAWQLPNSYVGPHEAQSRGRQKRMNRKLADLLMKGMAGNDKQADHAEPAGDAGGRLFFDSGATAAASYNRCPDQGIYWRGLGSSTSRCQVWHWLPPQASFGRHGADD
ncbi:MAG TPA: hypothetical protein VLE70_18695 [Anaerolineae bacterium]|nr:hypothetical protein [Anaerolineae bacterium]